MSTDALPMLCGILVHWHDEIRAAAVVEAWGDDPRFELMIVDNGSDGPFQVGDARVIRPAINLGFAGAVNRGLQETRAPVIVILNADCRPEPGALEQILAGLDSHPEASGLVPRLIGPDGLSQHRWQLRPLPTAWQLALQAWMVPVWSGPQQPPAAGTPIDQPAAAALAMRRRDLQAIGGMDSNFHPAWFEDVDLAARLKAAGKELVYWPDSTFVHDLGSSVATLGYGLFLWVHFRSLYRYLRKHHGPFGAEFVRLLMLPAALLRAAFVPFRKPTRAASRKEAIAGLWDHLLGIMTRWQLPRSYVRRFAAAPPDGEIKP